MRSSEFNSDHILTTHSRSARKLTVTHLHSSSRLLQLSRTLFLIKFTDDSNTCLDGDTFFAGHLYGRGSAFNRAERDQSNKLGLPWQLHGRYVNSFIDENICINNHSPFHSAPPPVSLAFSLAISSLMPSTNSHLPNTWSLSTESHSLPHHPVQHSCYPALSHCCRQPHRPLPLSNPRTGPSTPLLVHTRPSIPSDNHSHPKVRPTFAPVHHLLLRNHWQREFAHLAVNDDITALRSTMWKRLLGR